jgi:hypothetical protein
VPFFAVFSNPPAAGDDLSMIFPGAGAITLEFPSYTENTDVVFQAYVFIWSDDQADKDAAAAIVLDYLPDPIPGSRVFVSSVSTMSTPIPVEGVSYEIRLTSTEGYAGNAAGILAGHVQYPANYDITDAPVYETGTWTGTITWNAP